MLVFIITMLIREVQLYSTFFTTNNTIKASLMTAPQLTPDTNNNSCCFLLLLQQYSWTVFKLILWAYKNQIVWGETPTIPQKGPILFWMTVKLDLLINKRELYIKFKGNWPKNASSPGSLRNWRNRKCHTVDFSNFLSAFFF